MGDLPWNRIEHAGRLLVIARSVTKSVPTGLDREMRRFRVMLFKDERIEGGWVQGKVSADLMQGSKEYGVAYLLLKVEDWSDSAEMRQDLFCSELYGGFNLMDGKNDRDCRLRYTVLES